MGNKMDFDVSISGPDPEQFSQPVAGGLLDRDVGRSIRNIDYAVTLSGENPLERLHRPGGSPKPVQQHDIIAMVILKEIISCQDRTGASTQRQAHKNNLPAFHERKQRLILETV